jgi:hypothetical protein
MTRLRDDEFNQDALKDTVPFHFLFYFPTESVASPGARDTPHPQKDTGQS